MLDEELELVNEAETNLKNNEVLTLWIDLNKPLEVPTTFSLDKAADEREPIIILNPADNYSHENFYHGILQEAKISKMP